MTLSLGVSSPEIRIITTLGGSCGGKDYIGEIIAQMVGTTKLTISDILRIRAVEEGSDPEDMYNLMAISKRLSQETGDDGIIAKLLIDRARAEGKKTIVIAGMRQLAQFKHVISADPRAVCLYLHTHNQVRYQRYLKRYAADPSVTPESLTQFIESELQRNTWTPVEWRDHVVGRRQKQSDRLELFSFAEVCQYHWLSDGSVYKRDPYRHLESMPTNERARLDPIIGSDPDALRWFLGGEELISPIEHFTTPDKHLRHNRRTSLNTHIAARDRARTLKVLGQILSDGGVSIASK